MVLLCICTSDNLSIAHLAIVEVGGSCTRPALLIVVFHITVAPQGMF